MANGLSCQNVCMCQRSVFGVIEYIKGIGLFYVVAARRAKNRNCAGQNFWARQYIAFAAEQGEDMTREDI